MFHQGNPLLQSQEGPDFELSNRHTYTSTQSIINLPRSLPLQSQDDITQSISNSIKVDKLIKLLAFKYKQNWKKIAERIQKIEGKKIDPSNMKLRYQMLRKKLGMKVENKNLFTGAEDLKLTNLAEKMTFDWQEISLCFSSRSSTSLKNRYYYLKRKERQENNESKMQTKNSKQIAFKTSIIHDQLEQKLLIRDLDIGFEPEWLNLINSMLIETKNE